MRLPCGPLYIQGPRNIWGLGGLVPSNFCRFVNPISNRGGRLCSPHKLVPTKILLRSAAPDPLQLGSALYLFFGNSSSFQCFKSSFIMGDIKFCLEDPPYMMFESEIQLESLKKNSKAIPLPLMAFSIRNSWRNFMTSRQKNQMAFRFLIPIGFGLRLK